MSGAFVKETDNDGTVLPDRPISHHRNLVTEAGLAAIEAALKRFETMHRSGTRKDDREATAFALRELRYWKARRASAELVRPPENSCKASFGRTIKLQRADGRQQTFTIVGEDEADPARGTVSYVSPIARAVLGHSAGDVITIVGGEATLLEVR